MAKNPGPYTPHPLPTFIRFSPEISITLPLMPRSDAEIWQDILSGNAKAWKELIKRYQALVNTVAVRSGLSIADAADLLSNKTEGTGRTLAAEKCQPKVARGSP